MRALTTVNSSEVGIGASLYTSQLIVKTAMDCLVAAASCRRLNKSGRGHQDLNEAADGRQVLVSVLLINNSLAMMNDCTAHVDGFDHSFEYRAP